MNRRNNFAIAASLALCACATPVTGSSKRTDLIIAIGEENVRVGEQTFQIGDADAMRAGFAGACANECKQVEVRAIPMTRYDAILASYMAAVENRAGAIIMRIAASEPIVMAAGADGSPSSVCPTEIVLKKQAVEVYVDGDVLPPDNECDTWGVTVCDSKAQDPLKRREFEALGEIVQEFGQKFENRTCIYAESEMPALLIERMIHTVRSNTKSPGAFSLRRDKRPGRLNEEQVTEAIVAQGDTLTACYNAELEKTATPMSVVARMLIGPAGRVQRFEYRETEKTTPSFETCVETAFRAMTFPKPDHGGNFEMTYPLRFTPR